MSVVYKKIIGKYCWKLNFIKITEEKISAKVLANTLAEIFDLGILE